MKTIPAPSPLYTIYAKLEDYLDTDMRVEVLEERMDNSAVYCASLENRIAALEMLMMARAA